MAEYAVQNVGDGVAAVTYAAPAGSGDLAGTGSRRELRVRAGATPTTVTVVGARACNLGQTHDKVLTIAANTEGVIPLTPERFGRDSDGKAVVNYTSTATITVALVQI